MITLLTDFGTIDPYVGVMKGVIHSIDPSASIVDITHEIAPHDLAGAAYAIFSSFCYFPTGSIHVIVVDPGVGSDRSIIAVSMSGHYFLAPDNGVLDLILATGKTDFITTVENDSYFLKPVSQTFHGRDIFAPVAGYLSKGVSIDRLGVELNRNHALQLNLPMPSLSQAGELVGEIIRIDRFGNLITNIDHQLIQKTFGSVKNHNLKISIEDHSISGLSTCYQDVELNSLLAITGSMGFIEISVNCGSASEFCGASKGNIVSIKTTESL